MLTRHRFGQEGAFILPAFFSLASQHHGGSDKYP
jgi:hypothetical protein